MPKSQLIAQWRELNSIFKKQDNHILINYIYEYDKEELLEYTCYVIQTMQRNGIKINSYENLQNYFGLTDKEIMSLMFLDQTLIKFIPFKKHHTLRYLKQCFWNLAEKYDRGQKDFDEKLYQRLEKYVKGLEQIIENYMEERK